MHRKLTGVVAVALTCLPLLVQSQPAPLTAAELVTYHQKSFPSLRDCLRRIKAVVSDTKAHGLEAVHADAVIVHTMLRHDDAAAIRRIDDSIGGAEVWKEQERLRASSKATLSKAEELVGASALDDLESVKVALNTLGQACAACHADYRVK